MYKVLIADDEPMHRKGIRNLIAEIRPDYQLFEARDGEEALRVIDAEDIRIVITDIRMPGMDGLEMMQLLGNRIQKMKIAILSAYGNFQYAKKALTLGAFDYVLKPVIAADIEQIIQKMEESLDEDLRFLQERASMERKLQSALPAYREQLLSKWTEGVLTPAELEEVHKLIPQHSDFRVAITELHKLDSQADYPLSLTKLESDMKTCMEEEAGPLTKVISFFPDGRRRWMVSILLGSPGEDVISHTAQIENKLGSFLDRVARDYRMQVNVGISDSFARIYENMHQAHKQAMQALTYTFYYEPMSVIPYRTIQVNPERAMLAVYTEEDALYTALTNSERETVTGIIEHVFRQITANGLQPPNRLIEDMYYFIIGALNKLDQLLLKEQTKNLVAKAEAELWDCRYLGDLQDKVIKLLYEIMGHIESRRNNKNSEIIHNCKHYIEENYMQDISLEAVAKMFYFNPAYFSSFFKNYTGIGFTEFIVQTRLKKAKELLTTTDDKISEIAVQVGYKDPGYFTKVFKRENGAGPEEFRRNLGNHASVSGQ